MQITVEIPDELAAKVQASGLSPEAYVRNLIEEAMADSPRTAPDSRPKRDMDAFFRDMAANSDKIPVLPDEAYTRESFYRDHD